MRALSLLLVLAVLACCASAARVTPEHLSISKESLSQSGALLQHWISHNNRAGGKGRERAYVAFRYYVDTEEKNDFVEAWQELEKSTSEEKGNLIYDLKKPMTNNIEFIGYGEWKSFDDFMDHFRSDYVKSFIDKLMKHDVAFTIEPLDRPDVGEVKPSKEQKEEKQQAHVIIRYHVPPSTTSEFLDAWDEARRGTEKEKGANIYSLRKVWWDNTHYYAYGTWDSMADYRDHFRSGHVRQLRKKLDQHGIVWNLSPLVKMGNQPE